MKALIAAGLALALSAGSAHAATRRVPGMSVTYVSQRGYQGTDRVVIDMISPTGAYAQHTFNIDVR
jgi:hypothetical protein